jgi:hypothetical protein
VPFTAAGLVEKLVSNNEVLACATITGTRKTISTIREFFIVFINGGKIN